ncbi:tetratricopeptide repeat (TPR)-like superfamily protein [Actinidia rufa]|uniref:Tetratricopeptide repeat (TPR)-like superfamily protein n=1 Tax=Actinidia rufa TaxID=165716 RepID=A0A7J0GGG5_9ERIC|nr:tetratricopeptide repeat (TPR)-like superfamily protein [Actinidia rufa]
MYSSSGTTKEFSDPTKGICKIMMSCPKLGLHTALDQSGIRVSPDVVEEVLKKFENAGMLTNQFFEWAGKQRNYEHSIRAYHAMIESLAKIRQYKIVWDLVNSMRSKKILNIETFCIIMRKYARAQKVDEAIYTFNVMEKYDVPPNLAAFNGLLSALCKSKNVRKAQEIFDTGRVNEAVEIVMDMDAKGCRPTSFIYSVLVHTYGIENQIEKAVDTFLEMESNGIKADVAVYNALISAFCKVNKFQNAYRVLNEMESKGVVPNSRTCNIILNSLIDRGETDEAFRVFRRMIKICDPDADTYTMMIKMFCEKDELEMAHKVWKYMKSKQFVPSMHTFSALINGLCKKGEVSKACVLMEDMIEKGLRPSRVTFGRLRELLIKEGRQDVLDFLNQKMNLLVKEPLCD